MTTVPSSGVIILVVEEHRFNPVLPAVALHNLPWGLRGCLQLSSGETGSAGGPSGRFPGPQGVGGPSMSVLDRQSCAQLRPLFHLGQRLEGGDFCWVTGMVETRVLCLCVGHPLAKCPGWLHL